jgi:hypothetical protein
MLDPGANLRLVAVLAALYLIDDARAPCALIREVVKSRALGALLRISSFWLA